MPVVLSKASGTAFAVGLAAVAIAIRNAGERVAEPRLDPKAQLFVARAGAGKGRDKVAVDKVFAKRMWRLLKILVPGPLSPEFGFASLTALLMVARTWCDVWMISKRTSIEAKIIAGNNKAFMAHLTGFVLGLVPIAVVTSMLKYSLSELAMRFRTRLTNHLITEYMRGHTSYKIANVDNRISNADQLLTQDAMLFCNSVADLYSNVSKPLLDMGLYTYKLSGAIGMQGPGNMLAYLAVSGVALTWLRRPVGRFTVNEQKLEGEYRYVHSRLITHSEEVAFYNGNEREKWVVETVFERLMHHVRRAQQFRFSLGVIDTIVAKYFATVVGFWVVSRPFFKHSMPAGSPIASMTHAQRLEAYYESGRMLLNLAMAVGRLVLAGREMTRLAGFTARVTQLMDVLDDLNNGRFQRTMVGQSSDALAIKDKAKAKAKGAAGGAGAGPGGKAPEDDGGSGSGAGGKDRRPRVSSQINEANMGEIVYQDHIIRFEDVPLKTPNNDTLVESLSFEVRSGMNVLVAGPNGCGKSSLFRILGELWPLFGGRMVKPDKRHLFYIPQKPFMTLGTLRDQIIYPMAKGEMAAAGLTDADIRAVLAEVHLSSLEEREGGFDAVQDWADVLSGGEKQRVAMARLFVHKPQFAILDECTSAVSVDVEGYMYRRCRELNITLFTVSHRQTLWKFHEYLLRFDGRGKYEYRPIEGAEVFGS